MTCDKNLATTLSRDLNGLWRAIAASILRRVNIPLEIAAQYEGLPSSFLHDPPNEARCRQAA